MRLSVLETVGLLALVAAPMGAQRSTSPLRPAKDYFISAGVGGGRLEANTASTIDNDLTSPIGPAFRIGAGYDFTVTKALAVTPFASFVHVDAGIPRNGAQKMRGKVFVIGVEANLFTRQLLGSN